MVFSCITACALRLGEKHKTTANWQAICASPLSASLQLLVLLGSYHIWTGKNQSMCLMVQYRFYIEVLACNFMGQEFWILSDWHVLIKKKRKRQTEHRTSVFSGHIQICVASAGTLYSSVHRTGVW